MELELRVCVCVSEGDRVPEWLPVSDWLRDTDWLALPVDDGVSVFVCEALWLWDWDGDTDTLGVLVGLAVWVSDGD